MRMSVKVVKGPRFSSTFLKNILLLPGQDATNVLLNYLLEKKTEFKSSQVDRSKAVKLGQQLMNNGFYKPGFDLLLN